MINGRILGISKNGTRRKTADDGRRRQVGGLYYSRVFVYFLILSTSYTFDMVSDKLELKVEVGFIAKIFLIFIAPTHDTKIFNLN
jgi:hypothetical protein